MSTILEQRMNDLDSPPPINSLELPFIAYNTDIKQITITAIIFPAADGTYVHRIPPICIPGPIDTAWCVQWNLLSVGGLSATFKTIGITLVPTTTTEPSPIAFSGLRTLPFPNSNQCQAKIINKGQGFAKYSIHPTVANATGVVISPQFASDSFDPTIAVVEEPMG